ncbi:CHAP domain-containing protein [Streptococcus phocae]|uniref:Immunogenic secreted protein n=1 Tax=Streptococcus phocae TaxID=119224 RepID=A0A0N8FX70_9STRE|nr:CHAP domain-containing protein [Streptococcus phocae]KPJ22307.1 immunogenic secreted protein [Streptococcus phocae]
MRREKLLRLAMLMTLLAPQLGGVGVLAQDVDTSGVQAVTTPNTTAGEQTVTVSGDSAQTDQPSGTETPSVDQPKQPEVKHEQPPQRPEVQPSPAPSLPTPPAIEPPVVVPVPPSVTVPSTGLSGLPSGFTDFASVKTEAAYVAHWSGDKAYTHNLLSRRYGITAEQIDGFLKSLNMSYNVERVNGTKFLEWEKKSGLDVRAIVAFAVTETKLGTQGTSNTLGGNMFGYQVFDVDSHKPNKYNDELAIIQLTQEAIVRNHNLTLELQDQKADKVSSQTLNFAKDGGAYFAKKGQERADIMTKLDAWIDQHGGTPAIPEALRIQASSRFANVPLGFKTSGGYDILNYVAGSYPWGQCTWYVYNRAKELGYQFDAFMGNGGDWKHKAGYETTQTPKIGYAVSFAPGQAGADGTYGHVSIVEDVREDGSILISESNCIGLGHVSYRTFTAQEAKQLTYVVGQK